MKSLLTILLLAAFILPVRSLAQITAAENGLTKETTSTDVVVKLGGTLYNAQTSIDFGSGNSSSALLFKKGSTNYLYIANGGNIGIGTNSPDTKLHLAGSFKLVDGTQGNGKVLTSDANGVATWQTPSGSSQWTTASDDIYSNNSGNVGIGASSPASKLHVVGTIRVDNSTNTTPLFTAYRNGVNVFEVRANTDGDAENFNLFIGKNAGLNVSPDGQHDNSNTSVGNNTLMSLTDGQYNTALGTTALSNATTGNANLALGNSTLYTLTTGTANTAVGSSSLLFANGSYNTSVGTYSGLMAIGNDNTFIGSRAGFYNLGSSNTFVGKGAGENLDTGSYNVIIGANDGQSIEGLSNHILIADGAGNQRLKINNNSAYYIGGSYGTSGQVLTSNGSGSAPTWQTPSGGGGGGLWTDAGSGHLYNTTQTGSIAIGLTTIPSGYKLAVAGNIIAEKVKTKLQATGWPDFVFRPEYNLLSLKEVEQFIKQNNHLPGVPGANEIEQNGLDLGDGQATLLKKIEELTLYMIEMNKQIEKLNEENKQFKKQITTNK